MDRRCRYFKEDLDFIPKSAGGFNISDIQAWNKAAICKLLRNASKKKKKDVEFNQEYLSILLTTQNSIYFDSIALQNYERGKSQHIY